jgi:hypothetical protein
VAQGQTESFSGVQNDLSVLEGVGRPVPFVEFLIKSQPGKQHFFRQFRQPVEGNLVLPELPGLGLELDENKIERREDVSF